MIPHSPNSKPHSYVCLARYTVTRLLNHRPLPVSGIPINPDETIWDIRRACFVSIKTRNGSLRGCIGTLAPVHPRVDLEIIDNAVSASTRDPRFYPMREEELNQVLFSVDILSDPEPVTDCRTLNPKQWGVIVYKEGRRGVLLPDLEGVDTVEQQLEIASQKAGITDLDGAELERFRVDRYSEHL